MATFIQTKWINDLEENGWETIDDPNDTGEFVCGGPVYMRKVGTVIQVMPDGSIEHILQYDDIEVGHSYYISYTDPNYPCRCPCHSNLHEGLRHCVPCCYDSSYYGPARCFAKDNSRKLIHFRRGDMNYIVTAHAVKELK